MDNTNSPSPESHDQTPTAPEPEVLKPRADDGTPPIGAAPASPLPAAQTAAKRPRRRTYRPSHKATFIGLAAVVLILAINAGILGLVLKNKSKTGQLNNGQVTISSAALSKVGVNSSSLGDSGVVLQVGPNAQFDGKMTVAGDVNIGGQLKLNSTFSASDANLTQLEAGNTSLSQLEVNGNTTLSNVSLRNGLAVQGATQLQGPVTISQLLTVTSNLSVVGNVAVGGTLSTKTFSANSLTSNSTLTIGGHVITGGSEPSAGPGGAALGSNGTMGISGNDTAGSISINIGTGAVGGTLANVAFHAQYSSPPRVVISAVNIPPSVTCGFYVLNLSVGGFSVEDSCGLPPGGYSIDYIVEQ